MTTLVFIYNDQNEPRDKVVKRIPLAVMQNADILSVIDMNNTMEVIKDRGGNTGAKFDAKTITVSMPERSINITPKP